MGKLSTHVLNLVTGKPAVGMRIELLGLHSPVATVLTEVVTNADGRTDSPLVAEAALTAGRYALVFHTAEYFQAAGVQLAEPPFLDEVVIHFGIADVTQNWHVPLLVTPWSYSTYRGS